uniref:Kinesin motor domain-containing protein n=1 Tax=Macrostomum lignano TaxID=282301 RepID=A0A1I8FXD9_9PLAT
MSETDKVKVAVRLRPMNKRELELQTTCIVEMKDNQTFLHSPHSNLDGGSKQPKVFAFDHCFWSMDPEDSRFASQADVFEALGTCVLDSAFQGYNGCIFAYGQTGSGKSYTMMGSQDTQKGIIPRLCDAMFNRIQSQGATDDSDIDSLMNEGNKSRTVAATNMNNESSRSHAVFNITLTQTVSDCQLDVQGEKVSKLSLVDLAGSERAVKTGAVGDRLREGSNINKSLTTLGLVISALADNSKTKKFVPYRDSVLTWLLKDNLGGNSRTLMVATLSPAGDNYEETLSTLRYADRAKRIVNHAVVNEDPNARIIRELREEVETLKAQLESAQAVAAPQLTEKLQESEKLMKEMSKTWEEKLLETERRHKERHEALEKMGVSVQASGIRVDSSSCYLVNLNADPSLNELLVYYLKERTCIGCAENQDIQLNGLGIKPQHCVITVSNEDDVLIAPQPHARTLLNGCEITSPTKAKHGDRILWGNHHYFRVNHPKMAASASHETSNFDYADAQAEVALNGTSSESLRLAMEALERRYESDKEEALARQKQMYEGLLKNFSNILSPATPSYCPPMMLMSHDGASSSFSLNSSGAGGCEQGSSDGPEGQQLKAQQLNLSRLKEQLARANALVREANFLSAELGAGVEYSVTLQIPAHNLIRRHIATEPAIQLTAAGSDEDADSPGAVLATWSLDKFENRLVDMRESYHEFTAGSTDSVSAFRDHHEQHDLIGVAHAFLSPLFYDAPLDYNVPVINTQGEIAGKLHVRLAKFSGRFEPGQQVTLKRQGSAERAVALCVRAVPAVGHVGSAGGAAVTADCGDPPPDLIAFDHEAQFDIFVNDEFLEFAADGSLAVQVYGNRSNGAEVRGERIGDNWSEYCRRLEMWLCIQELSENGQYLPVEIQHPTQRDRQGREKDVIPTGGVYRLKHGQSRRLLIRVRPVSGPESGSLPVICERITDVSVGCIVRRDRSMQRGLDSYQEEDLTRLRDKWREAVSRRQGHLQSQLSLITSKPVKTAADEARERSLMEQWSRMTVEKEAVLVPRPHSCVPGAPADWDPPLGMEEHIPVLFLDLQPDHHQRLELPPAGVNSQLPKEHNSEFVQVPIMRSLDKDCCVICQWDASLHDSIYLNRITGNNELIYLIVRARVRISHPAPMDIVLRKRACVSVYKSKGIRSALFGYMRAYVSPASADPIRDLISETGITYQIVSSIPPATGEVEDRKSLAVLAAASSDAISSLAGPAEDSSSCSLLAESSAISDSKLTDGNSAAPAAPGSAASSNGSWRPAQPDSETYIKQYLSAVSAVDYFLREEKARQEAAVKFSKNAKTRATRKSMQVMGADGGVSCGCVGFCAIVAV